MAAGPVSLSFLMQKAVPRIYQYAYEGQTDFIEAQDVVKQLTCVHFYKKVLKTQDKMLSIW